MIRNWRFSGAAEGEITVPPRGRERRAGGVRRESLALEPIKSLFGLLLGRPHQ
jgi:hypothetical protein